MVVSAMEMMSSWPVWETWDAGVKAPSVHWFARIPSFQGTDDKAAFTHGKGTRISAFATCVCFPEGPLETGKLIFQWEPCYDGTWRLRWAHQILLTIVWPWLFPAVPGSWASAPPNHGHFARSQPPRTSSTLDRRKFYNNYFIVISLITTLQDY